MTTKIRIRPDPESLARDASREAATVIRSALDRQERIALCLCGGSTPRTFYAALAQIESPPIPWHRVHLFWGDERLVPAHHRDSNQRMVRECLIDKIRIAEANVHPMPTSGAGPETAADRYEATLRGWFFDGPPAFDLLLLGLGDDGHTASLFPGDLALSESERWVVPARAPYPPFGRLTLTFPVLNQARQVYFLVAGQGKARAVGRVLEGAEPPDICPAVGIRPPRGDVTWWLDREAAAFSGGV